MKTQKKIFNAFCMICSLYGFAAVAAVPQISAQCEYGENSQNHLRVDLEKNYQYTDLKVYRQKSADSTRVAVVDSRASTVTESAEVIYFDVTYVDPENQESVVVQTEVHCPKQMSNLHLSLLPTRDDLALSAPDQLNLLNELPSLQNDLMSSAWIDVMADAFFHQEQLADNNPPAPTPVVSEPEIEVATEAAAESDDAVDNLQQDGAQILGIAPSIKSERTQRTARVHKSAPKSTKEVYDFSEDIEEF